TRVKCSTSNCGSKLPGNKKNDRISQKLSRNKKNNVEAQPRKVNKLNRVAKPVGDGDVDVKHSLSNANSEILLQGRDFDPLPSEEDTMFFLRDLSHIGVINSLNDVVVDQMHQPWSTFAALINRSLSGKTTGLDKLRLSRAQIIWGMYFQKNIDYVKLLWEDFTYPIDNKEFKKKDKNSQRSSFTTS
ncbi:hypothetical protein Tco_0182501, partial [Tanacetum coccineum]